MYFAQNAIGTLESWRNLELIAVYQAENMRLHGEKERLGKTNHWWKN